MTGLDTALWNSDPTTGTPTVTAPSHNDALTIALVNNMPDAALQSTERQFCRVMAAASNGIVVRLKFYSPPSLPRSAAARLHISKYYEDFNELEHSSPDGLIVTGTEPRAANLKDEPCWDALSRLVDWAEDSGIPGIWSCLASHVAVLHLDGIQRRRLVQKLSGLYECRVSTPAHPALPGLPAGWHVPHSRLNGLPEDDLIAHGYTILSRSRNVGVDVFYRQHGCLQLFFQGHPEYEPTTLLGEYRRDVKRYIAGEAVVPPRFPRFPPGYIECAKAERLYPFSLPADRNAGPDSLGALDRLIAEMPADFASNSPARRIYFSWLSYLYRRRHKQMRSHPMGVSMHPACDARDVPSNRPHALLMVGTGS